MRYFIDTEFDENGKTISLISIAMVREDGAELYLISNEFDADVCNDWVKANVLPYLLLTPQHEWRTRSEIRDAVHAFVGDDAAPQFWGYFADYDWVVFCQLWGRMVDIPKGFPMYCMDLKQWAKQSGADIKRDGPPKPTDEHNALSDARWNARVYEWLSARA